MGKLLYLNLLIFQYLYLPCMGDSTKPSAGGEGENLVHLPGVKKNPRTGEPEVVKADGPKEKTNGEAPADVVAAISGIQDETVQKTGENVGNVVRVNFSKERQKTIPSSHTKPNAMGKGNKRSIGRINLAKSRPRPKKLDHKVDGLTVVPSQKVKTITGGKISEISEAALRHRENHAIRRGRKRLFQVVGLHERELSEQEAEQPAVAARNLEALMAEDFSDEKRETDQKFFHEVALILLSLWPRNWSRYLDDTRIEGIMQAIRDKDTHARILALIKNCADHPIS